MRSWLIAAIILFASSCGYVGEPLPPALNIPLPVTGLSAKQTGTRVRVGFLVPTLTTDGVAMRRLGSVEVTFNGKPVDAAAIKEPGPAQVEVPVGSWAGQHVEVAVRVSSLKGKFSTPAATTLDVIAPLSAPGDPVAVSHPQGVELKWKPAGAQTRILKRNLEVAKVDGDSWVDTDAKFGTPYEYRLQTVQGEAESELSALLAITPEDKFPPSTPVNFSGVTGINSIELTWDRSPEADTAGYRIYRAGPGEDFKPLQDDLSVAASFSDRKVKPGETYRYTVTAVDQKANESARSPTVEIAAP